MGNEWDQLEEALSADAYASAWRYCCRLAPSRQDAEDLLQDSLIHAYSKLGQLRERSRFRPWLLALIRSRFLNRLSPRRTVELAAPLELRYEAPDANPLAEEIAARLAQLPALQREVLELFYLEDLSIAETAQVLGIAQITVRQRLFRARHGLRQLLGVALIPEPRRST